MHVNYRGFLFLTFAFVVFTVIGTLSHEYGHILVARSFGFETQLHYAFMEWNDEGSTANQAFWISAGGPIQSMLFGTIGFLTLLLQRKRIEQFGLKILDWAALFLGLFWLRQIFNLAYGILLFLGGYEEVLFHGDERYLSESLNLPMGAISIFTASIGFFICCYLVFRIIPRSRRLTFLFSGLFGGILGFVVWMHLFGPLLLP